MLYVAVFAKYVNLLEHISFIGFCPTISDQWRLSISHQLVKEKFPSGASVKKSSPFKGLIREKKPKRERTEKEKAATVKAQTFKLKIKDIVTTAIEDLGNPVSL